MDDFSKTRIEWSLYRSWLAVLAGGLLLGALFFNYFMETMPGGIRMEENVEKYLELWRDRGFIIHIFVKRVGIFAFLVLCTLLIRRSLILYLSTAYFGFCFGVIIAAVTLSHGLMGIWQFIRLMLPHYLVYIPAYVMLIKWAAERKFFRSGFRRIEFKYDSLPLILIFAVVVAGCVLECYISPIWLHFFTKI